MRIDVENRITPPLKWVGGKSRLLAEIKDAMPAEFSKYHEPFLGGAAVFFSITDIKEGDEVWLSDLNEELIEFYEVLRDDPEALMALADFHAERNSETWYYHVRGMTSPTKEARAARTLYLNKAGFNGLYRTNKKGEFNVPYGKRESVVLYDRPNLLRASSQLRHPAVKLASKRFREALSWASEGSVVYCDPPYEPLTKTASFKAYTSDGFVQADQLSLCAALEKVNAAGAWVVTSNSSAEFIQLVYQNWQVKLVDVGRTVGADGSKRKSVKEVLAVLQWPSKLTIICGYCRGYMHAPHLCRGCYHGTVAEEAR